MRTNRVYQPSPVSETPQIVDPYERWSVQVFHPRRKRKWGTAAAGPAFWARRFFDDLAARLDGKIRLIDQYGVVQAESAVVSR